MKTRICNELLLKGDYSGHDILEMSNKTETYPRDSKVKLFPVGHTWTDAFASYYEALRRWQLSAIRSEIYSLLAGWPDSISPKEKGPLLAHWSMDEWACC